MTGGEDPRRSGELLASLSDDDIRGLSSGHDPGRGWGRSGPADLAGTTVFVKRVPVTAIEAERWPSTRNHFGLPLHYQYGVGSAGFGASREAMTHRTATEWVLDGTTDAFPILHHARLLPRRREPWTLPLDRDAYVAMWGGDPAVVAYVDARTTADHELWLVSEHLPHTLSAWLVDHQDRVDDVLSRLLDAARLMRENGMVHFDAHFENVVVDEHGDRFCLADFGLAMTSELELDERERTFLAAHRHYDAGEIVFSAAQVATGLYRRLSHDDRRRVQQVCGLPEDPRPGAVLDALLTHVGRIADEGLMPLHPRYVACLIRNRSVVEYMGDLLLRLAGDPHKLARHDDVELVARLRDCGVDVSPG